MLGSITVNTAVAAIANSSKNVSISETGTSAVKTTSSTADRKFFILFVCVVYYVLPLCNVCKIMTENHENFRSIRIKTIGIVFGVSTQ